MVARGDGQCWTQNPSKMIKKDKGNVFYFCVATFIPAGASQQTKSKDKPDQTKFWPHTISFQSSLFFSYSVIRVKLMAMPHLTESKCVSWCKEIMGIFDFLSFKKHASSKWGEIYPTNHFKFLEPWKRLINCLLYWRITGARNVRLLNCENIR